MAVFDVMFLPDRPPADIAKLARLVEDEGFGGLWVADEVPVPGFRDPWATLIIAALNTQRIRLGPGIAIPYHDHPVLMAVAVATLNEVSNGRAFLAIGRGGSMPLKPIGIDGWEKPMTALRESVEIIRGLFEGKTVEYEGEVFKARSVKLSPKPKTKIPIYLAARGPKTLGLAGRIADGVIMGLPPAALKYAINLVRKGASKSGREFNELDVSNQVNLSVSRDERKARAALKLETGWILSNSPQFALKSIGVTEKEVNALREALKKGPTAALSLITDKMIDGLNVAGKPDYCIKRLEECIENGLKHFVLNIPLTHEPFEAIKLVTKEILPSF